MYFTTSSYGTKLGGAKRFSLKGSINIMMYVKKGIPEFSSLDSYPLIRFVSNGDLVFLTRDEGLFSKDRHGNREIIKQVVWGLGKSYHEKFSCAAICHNDPAYNILKYYGNGEALLLIKKETVANQAFLFNGDFQNLSNSAKGTDGIQKTFSYCRLTDDYENFIESHASIQRVHQATCLRKDRLNGDYFECRIFRPLCLDDIEDIYVSDTGGVLHESLNDYVQRQSANLEKIWE